VQAATSAFSHDLFALGGKKYAGVASTDEDASRQTWLRGSGHGIEHFAKVRGA